MVNEPDRNITSRARKHPAKHSIIDMNFVTRMRRNYIFREFRHEQSFEFYFKELVKLNLNLKSKEKYYGNTLMVFPTKFA